MDVDERSRASREEETRWQAISRIVDGALELDTAERASYVREQCSDDAALEGDVGKFLDACSVVEKSGHFLNRPVGEYADALASELAQELSRSRAGLAARVAEGLSGRYDVKGELGNGGSSTVFRAHDRTRGIDIALKVLHPDVSEGLGAERFLREVRYTRSLDHPNIIPLLDAGVVDRLPYYVMPVVEGQTLKQRLASEHQLDVDSVVTIVRDVAAALDEAHAHGIVHRDVKPQNILLDGRRALVADFGIAHALETAGAERLTQSGVLIGTPAYMSPEQSAGERSIDQRSDVYSFGCVVYEMLVGEPPFTGVRFKAILARHILAPIPDVRILRPSVPADVHAVLSRALAKDPVERYASAGAFAHALEHALVTHHPEGRTRRRAIVAGAVTIAVLAIAATAWRRTVSPASSAVTVLDTTSIVLLPLEHDSAAAADPVDDDLLRESMVRRDGVRLIDRFLVADAVKRRGHVGTTADGYAVARALDGGRLVRGRVSRAGGGARLYIALYDVAKEKPLLETTAEIPRDLAAATQTYARIADRLLLRGANGRALAPDISQSRSLPALQAIGRARHALDDWELATADSALESALVYDVRDAWVNLWLAQVRAWRDLPVATWAALAARAADSDSALTARDVLLARALVALSAGTYATACQTYDSLRRTNPRDFAAWFGLGQCRRMDKLVVPDSGSPSRWRFRSSYDTALVSYMRAFELLPTSLHTYAPESFDRLRGLLLLSTTVMTGRSQDGKQVFHARPGWVNGHVVLIPYLWQQISAGDPAAVPPGFSRAIEEQRARFHRIATTWSAAFPGSATAKHDVAVSLALQRNPLATDTLRLARRLATDTTQQFALAAAEVLELVRFGVPDRRDLLERAGALADTLLDATPERLEPAMLAALATLRGRCAAAQGYNRRAALAPELAGRISSVNAANVAGALAHAALGCTMPLRSLADLEDAVDRDFQRLPAAERDRYREALFFRPALLAATLDSAAIAKLGAASTNQLVVAARLLVRRDTAGGHAALSRFASSWSEASGPVTPDVAFPEARLFLLVRDTAAAVVWLDRTIQQTATYDPVVLADHAILGALIRAMRLRADIAVQRGDRANARRFSTAVGVLWSRSDPGLRSARDDRMSPLGAR